MTTLLRSLSDDELFDWLRLIRSENVGPRTFAGLLSRFGSARNALEALPDLAAKSARAIKIAEPHIVADEMEASRRAGIRFLPSCDPAYPEALREIDSAPPVLAIKGRADILQRQTVAIVGSRNASAIGLVITDRIARGLGAAGYPVASGLARGIDVKAHLSTMQTGTIAVLAGGHGRIYPSDHAGLVDRIVEHGAVVSEMPLTWEPRARDFPRRNRIVSGLSLGVVVVEAARRSGSLITVRFALEQGRDVFAVPGSPVEPRAEGPNELIREGAILCRSAEDVLEGLRPLHVLMQRRSLDRLALREAGTWEKDADALWDDTGDDDRADQGSAEADPRGRLLALVSAAPVSVDDLVRQSGLPIRLVQSLLVELELEGCVMRSGSNITASVTS